MHMELVGNSTNKACTCDLLMLRNNDRLHFQPEFGAIEGRKITS